MTVSISAAPKALGMAVISLNSRPSGLMIWKTTGNGWGAVKSACRMMVRACTVSPGRKIPRSVNTKASQPVTR